MTERAIYLPTTGETFRPDRVVVTPDGCVTVVDYKFTTEAREGHRRQVELYISLLRRMGREKSRILVVSSSRIDNKV